MLRRKFLKRMFQFTAGLLALEVVPEVPLLRRINTTLFTPDNANAACSKDICSESDVCDTGDSGHTCAQVDVCERDHSGDCTADYCTSDRSDKCTFDRCTADSSGQCFSDKCISDSSGECTGGDKCISDSSGSCDADKCESDSSGICETDICISDSSGYCVSDKCTSDSSSTGCLADGCGSDSAGECSADHCSSDSSATCDSDACVSDHSGTCTYDICTADSSGTCTNDICTSDSSGICTIDNCTSDSGRGCGADKCTADYGSTCSSYDVCVLDLSGACESDLCREDRSSEECATSDTCSYDLVFNKGKRNSTLAQKGITKAIKWLYRISAVIIFLYLGNTSAYGDTVIEKGDFVSYPEAIMETGQDITVTSPVGPFLRDCDSDGILEADVNGDGLCADDPELQDHDGDGSMELPEGTSFSGEYEFSCFYIPDNTTIVADGPLTIRASSEIAVFGTVRLSNGGDFSTIRKIDLRTSAWLSEDESAIRFATALEGEINDTSVSGEPYSEDVPVPDIEYESLCPTSVDKDDDSGSSGRSNGCFIATAQN